MIVAAYVLFITLAAALAAVGCVVPTLLMAGLALMLWARPSALHRRQRSRHVSV